MTVKQNNVVRDYDGRPLEENEALALFPYNKLDAAQVTNPDCIRTARVAGRRFKCILKAVPKEYVALANSQYSDWENEVLPPRRDGRCLIPQGDGTFKECPRKKGDNHCSCAACPHKGEYEKKVKTFLSLDEAMDRYELEFSLKLQVQEKSWASTFIFIPNAMKNQFRS